MTQHYQADQCIPMCKYFHTHFPSANVCHLPEWYSMDTIIADCPAIDDGVAGHGGCTMVQIYGGIDLELLLGLSSESELSDTLCNFIHEYGAMDALSSTTLILNLALL